MGDNSIRINILSIQQLCQIHRKSYISFHHWKHAPIMAMSPPPIQRTSSIEMEPRTLGIDQIRSARVTHHVKPLLFVADVFLWFFD